MFRAIHSLMGSVTHVGTQLAVTIVVAMVAVVGFRAANHLLPAAPTAADQLPFTVQLPEGSGEPWLYFWEDRSAVPVKVLRVRKVGLMAFALVQIADAEPVTLYADIGDLGRWTVAPAWLQAASVRHIADNGDYVVQDGRLVASL